MTIIDPLTRFVVFPVTITTYHYCIFGVFVSILNACFSCHLHLTYFITVLFCSENFAVAVIVVFFLQLLVTKIKCSVLFSFVF